MDFETIIKVIQLLGFPAFMCIWFMTRLERKLDAIEATNHKQVVILAVLVRILGSKKESGAIPVELFDDVSGVTEIPLPAGSLATPVPDKGKGKDQ